MTHTISILMICPQFRPLVGGYERAAERLSGALAAMGLHIVVVTERRDNSWPANESVDGYAIQRLPCLFRRHLHAVTSLLAFACFLVWQGRRFDVWHVHQYGLHAALALALGKLLGRPVVLKLTNSATMGIEKTLGQGVIGHILRYLHRGVSACLAISEETRREAIAFGIPANRVRLIPNGIDGDHFCPVVPEEQMAARQALGLTCQKLVLFVGRLSPEKNLLGLVEAWHSIIPDARYQAVLAIVGNGPDMAKIEDTIQQLLSLTGSVYLVGNQRDVAIWYRAADIVVISSHNEGLSNTMLEALASGLPVISTRVSGSSVLLESDPAGLLVDINDPIQLAEAITVLLQDEPLRRRLAKNARHLFELHFSLTHLAQRTVLLYKQLLGLNAKQESF
jgi:glycosyltransferase involved in cell wall biosynthesis